MALVYFSFILFTFYMYVLLACQAFLVHFSVTKSLIRTWRISPPPPPPPGIPVIPPSPFLRSTLASPWSYPICHQSKSTPLRLGEEGWKGWEVSLAYPLPEPFVSPLLSNFIDVESLPSLQMQTRFSCFYIFYFICYD